MKSTTVAILLIWVGFMWTSTTRADRPGSYDKILSGSHPRSAVSPHHAHGGNRQIGSRPNAVRLPGYYWPGYRSIGFYVGVGPAYVYSRVLSYGTYNPGLSYGYWGPTGVYFDSASNYAEYYLPPIYAPAELAYGPRAVERFLGVRSDAAGPIPPAIIVPESKPAPAEAGVLASKLRKSNAASRERAGRFVTFGDALFLKQRFHEAVQRYKSAIEAAPDLSEAYYRQGFGLVAVSQYRLAARALRIAVELDPTLAGKEIQLDVLYGDNRLAKSAHLEQLVAEALERTGDGDMLFLVGMFLYCDGEPERAQKFLRKAADLAGPAVTFLAPLLCAHDSRAGSNGGGS